MSDYKTFSNEELGKTGAVFSISWLDVCYKVKTSDGLKQLLFNVNGHVEPGSTLAIMGPSGSGKTTLLNILADRVSTGEITGEVLVDGSPRGSVSCLSNFFQKKNVHTASSRLKSHFNGTKKKLISDLSLMLIPL